MQIDWDDITAEATDLLREYLRIDTSNPPGNEALAVDFIGRILEREGIAFERAESAPGRDNLYARMGPVGGVTLLNHTDVVPVEVQFWDVEPFGGLQHDGMIWGRGALDMKGMGIIELLVFLLVKRTNLSLRRGLSFLAVADEEAGSEFGMTWVQEHRRGWMDTALVINEGSYGLTGMGGKDTPIFQFSPTEKVPLWLKLTVHGRPGHGSVPHGDNCAEHLIHALERVTRWEQAPRLTPIMRAHVAAMARAGAPIGTSDKEILASAARNPAVRARLTNTISLTTLQSGIKANVIPAEATATLDCRLLPDVDPDAFLADLRKVIDDERVEIGIFNRYEGAASTLEGEFVTVVRDVIAEYVEGSQLAPEMTTGFTDSRIYRKEGIQAYGFVPCLVRPEELAGVHGHNERISVENLRLGIQVLFEVVRRLCSK